MVSHQQRRNVAKRFQLGYYAVVQVEPEQPIYLAEGQT